jgi:cyclin B
MRSILVDWLVEIHAKFKLIPQSLWLAVNLMDRYLETVQIARGKLQLVGVAALLIACKFEEIYPPEVNDCVYITDYAYDKKEILAMESAILKELNFQVCVPTGYHFLSRYLNCIQASDRTRLVAYYYAERNMQEADMLLVLPHKFAAAAVYAALKQANWRSGKLRTAPVWNRTLEEESGLKEADLTDPARTIVRHLNEDPETASKRKLNAVRKKYSSEVNAFVSTLPVPSF